MVVPILWKSLMQNLQPQHQWRTKILLPWAQRFYTPLVLERGWKCPWRFFPPAVVVSNILSLIPSTSPINLLVSAVFPGIWQRFVFKTKPLKMLRLFLSIFKKGPEKEGRGSGKQTLGKRRFKCIQGLRPLQPKLSRHLQTTPSPPHCNRMSASEIKDECYPVLWRKTKGQQDREPPTEKSSSKRVSGRTSENLREPRRGALAMKTKSQKQTFRRFSEILLETLLEEDFLSETLGPVAPHRDAP